MGIDIRGWRTARTPSDEWFSQASAVSESMVELEPLGQQTGRWLDRRVISYQSWGSLGIILGASKQGTGGCGTWWSRKAAI